MNEYATLRELRDYLSLASQDNADDAHLINFLQRASRAIDRFTRRKFYPRKATLRYDYPDNSRLLKTKEDILSVNGLSHMNGASEVDSSVYWLKCGGNWNLTPYDRIEIDDSSGSLFNYSGTPQRALVLDAILGFRQDYSQDGWVDSSASLTADLASQLTLASISGSGGTNEFGMSPRFTGGQVWRIGTEYLYASAISVSNDTASVVRVIRGINGTTAQDHTSETTVEVYSFEPDIQFMALRLAATQYIQKSAPFTERLMFPGMGSVDIPSTWPPDIIETLTLYKKHGYE